MTLNNGNVDSKKTFTGKKVAGHAFGLKWKLGSFLQSFIFWMSSGRVMFVGLPRILVSRSTRPSRFIVNRIGNTLTFTYEGRQVSFFASGPGNLLSQLREVFESQIYHQLDVKNRIVVDVGANIGDTAIYFCLRGAQKVIALEPYPSNFKAAKANIEANGVQDKVILVNAAVAGERGVTHVDERLAENSADLRTFNAGTGIPLVPIDDLVEEYSIHEGILKIDCEGSEYEILRNSSLLGRFSQIMVEYHYGAQDIPQLLKMKGFAVKKLYPSLPYRYNRHATEPKTLIGLIGATRVDRKERRPSAGTFP